MNSTDYRTKHQHFKLAGLEKYERTADGTTQYAPRPGGFSSVSGRSNGIPRCGWRTAPTAYFSKVTRPVEWFCGKASISRILPITLRPYRVQVRQIMLSRAHGYMTETGTVQKVAYIEVPDNSPRADTANIV